VDHAAEACESRELVKAVLDGRARGVFQGKVIVRRGARKTDGKQMANALLLSDDAEFDSKPELEIFADDVACGHGSTAGQIDEDLMFYLRARGLPEGGAGAAHRRVPGPGAGRDPMSAAALQEKVMSGHGNDRGRTPSCPSPREGMLFNRRILRISFWERLGRACEKEG
jgi:hypothetical protein